MIKRIAALAMLVTFATGLAVAQKSTPPVAPPPGVTFTVSPSPAYPNQAVTITANAAGYNPPLGVTLSRNTSYLFMVMGPGESTFTTIRTWGTSGITTHTPVTAGTYRYRALVQLVKSNGDPYGNNLPMDKDVVADPPSTPNLQSPADNATVSADSGVTFTWSSAGSNVIYDLCLSKQELTCGSDAKIRYNLNGTSTTFTSAELSGFTGMPLWWSVKARKTGYDPTSSSKRKVTITGGTPPPLSWTWTTRLTVDHFTAAGATLTTEQTNKLTQQTYTINSIVNSSTDRLYDNMSCNSCHDGNPNQSPDKYRPVLTSQKSTAHRKDKDDANTTPTYRWNNIDSTGVVRAFKDSTYSKPDMLEKIFQKWLDMGAQ